MSVERELGVSGDVASIIEAAWEGWVVRRPQLAMVTDRADLRTWMQQADVGMADEVLHSLAWLASTEQGDDVDAAAVLAWLLLPVAAFVAHQLRTLTDDIDHVVAGELWVQTRSFPLRRHKVASNVMRDLRSAVLEACEAPSVLKRKDPIWFARATSAAGFEGHGRREVEPTAADELGEVMDWACENRIIDAEECRLLLSLVRAAEGMHVRGGRLQGLLANEATEWVALQWGLSGRTVRRRARASIAALAAAAPRYSRVA